MSRPTDGSDGKLMGAFVAAARLKYADETPAQRAARLRQLLDDKIHGLCFSAYVEGQHPDDHVVLSDGQVRERLGVIAPHCRWIRTFACTEGNELAASLGKEMGLKTLVGAWVGDDPARNEEELEGVIRLARGGHVDRIAVGNEVLLRGEASVEQIVELMRRTREAVPGVPVGYVDAYFQFIQHPALVEACDFLPINCYPFWEKCPIDQAVPYAAEMVRRVQAVAQGKPVIIAETGWPSEGPAEGAAEPSLDNMILYALNLVEWSADNDVELFWFSAFDEAWKVGAEGGAGAYWGLWTSDGRLKVA
ncbi:MAG: glycosyl hydrolase family 17 protein [Myxococcota bacterium]